MKYILTIDDDEALCKLVKKSLAARNFPLQGSFYFIFIDCR